MKRIITIIIIVAVLGLIGFRLYSNKQAIDENKKVVDKSDVAIAVNTATVTKGISNKSFTMLGTVAPDQAVEIKAETAGQVEELYVKLGDELKKGARVARIDNQLLRIGLSNAEQKLADANQNFVRYKNLYDGGAASQAQYDQYKLAFENAQNQVAEAKRQLQKAMVTAPFNGVITKKSIDEGAFVTVGGPIATIVDVKNLKVQLNVSEHDAYALRVGDPVKITASVFPGVEYDGQITFISPQGDNAHNYPVEIAFKNKEDNALKAGTYVNVNFSRKSTTEVIQVPRAALVGSIQNAKVYVVRDGMATAKSITVGSDNGDYLEVINGLQPGEEVVVTGQINLSDNTKVQVIQ